MIYGVLGKPGNGKSIKAVSLIEEAVRSGRIVATNIRLNPAACWFEPFVVLLDDDGGKAPVFRLPMRPKGKLAKWAGGEVLDYCAWWHYMPRGCFYVVDEIDNYLDSMDFMKLAEEATDARYYFKQHRKRGDDVVWVAQSLENVWNRLRRMTQLFYVCEHNYRSRPLFQTLRLPKWMSSFIIAEFGEESLSKLIREGYMSWGEAQRYFPMYQTEQIIGDKSLFGWRADDVKSGSVDVGAGVGCAGNGGGSVADLPAPVQVEVGHTGARRGWRSLFPSALAGFGIGGKATRRIVEDGGDGCGAGVPAGSGGPTLGGGSVGAIGAEVGGAGVGTLDNGQACGGGN